MGIKVKKLTKSEAIRHIMSRPWHNFLTHKERWEILVACKNEIDTIRDSLTGEFLKGLAEGEKLTEIDIKIDTEAAVDFVDGLCEAFLKQKKKYVKKVEERRRKEIEKVKRSYGEKLKR